MVPIRKGDGTGLAAKRVSQVRKGDGTVLWNAIPDSGLLHNYDWAADSTTTSFVEDQRGNADLDAGSFSSFGTFRGKQAGTFDGASDFLRATYTDTQPIDIFLAGRVESINNATDPNIMLGGVDGFFHTPYISDDSKGGEWGIYSGAEVFSGVVADTQDHIWALQIDGTSSALRLDGTETVSGNTGSLDPGGMTVAADKNTARHANITIARILVYDPNAAGYSVSEVEGYLNSEYAVY